MRNKKNILIVAGELSGDMHAAKLVRDIKSYSNDIEFFGMGGVHMQKAGVDVLVDVSDLAIVGILEVITNITKIFAAMKTLRQALATRKPDLVILVDYPGFNLRFAKIAKKSGCKILYYISPQLWAWHTSRVKLIKKYINKMAVILPFEVDFYKKFNVLASFVGHPLVDKVYATMDVNVAKERFFLEGNKKIIGLFPGSRKGELKRLLPIMLRAGEKIREKFPNVQFVLPLASSLSEDDLQNYIGKSDLDVKIVKDQLYDVIQVCDAIIAVSGTVTLEIALMGIPMVIVYKFFPPYFSLKWVSRIPYIGICNIITGKEIVKEFLQQHVTPKNIAKEITHVLEDAGYKKRIQTELAGVKSLLNSENVENLSELVFGML